MDQPTSKEPRGPVSLRIKFRSASLDQFIERYAVDVSRGGIFIRTREPLPVGTQLRFDFQLQDAAPLLAGEGTIVWIRENDPARAGVTPGMGVRFDKLTAASQPVLEKILAEKTRREQAGAPAKTGPAGGMAVRRPSSTFSALDPAAARAVQAASGPPRVGGLSPLGAQPRAAAPATGSGPLGAQPRAAASGSGSGPAGAQPRAATSSGGSGPVGAQPRTTAPAIGSDPFGTRGTSSSAPRTADNAVPAGIPTLESSGAFGRPRSTTGMNAQRPAPAPSALFEKPTADDIDRALSVLTEIDGPAPAPAPVPVDFSSRVRRPTDAQPMVLEATPDVGDAPKAAHRRPTDAQPMVLESTPDAGEAPSRRLSTQPFFSGTATGESKLPTVPVFPLGDAAPGAPLLDQLHDEEEEDDATSAWVGSGPTRVGEEGPLPAAARPPAPAKPPAFPKFPAADKPAAAKSDKSDDVLGGLDLHKPAAPPPALSLAAPAPRPSAPSAPPAIMAPDFAAPPAKKKGSGATAAIVVLVLLGGAAGGAYYVLKGPGRGLLGSAAPAPAPAPAPEATAPAAAPEGTAPAAQAGAAGATAAPSELEKPAEKRAGDTATPIYNLRVHPEGEAPKEATAEAKPAAGREAKPEAKPDEAKPTESKSEGKSGGHKGKRRAAAEAAAPEAPAAAGEKPAVVDVSPTAPAEGAAAAPSGEAAKPAGANHLLKISSSPAGAEVIVDGTSMGTTPFSSGDVDPALPHSVTIKKEGFEAYEHMIGGSDWPHAKNGVRTLKLNAKLRSTGGDTAKPAEGDTPAAEPPPGLGSTPASPKRE